MSKPVCILLLLSGLFFAAFGQTQLTSDGAVGALFLRSPLIPRITAMGEASSALAAESAALYYNPAGLTDLPRSSISLHHTESFEDINFDNLLFGYPITPRLSAAAGISHRWMPAIPARGELGENIGSIDVASTIIRAGVGYKLNSRHSLGVTVKYFRDDLAGLTATGAALDFGGQIQLFRNRLRLGAVVQNIGSAIRYEQSSTELPRTFRAGIGFQVINNHFSAAADYTKTIGAAPIYSSGFTILPTPFINFRLGAQWQHERGLNPSFGFDLKLQKKLFWEYALITNGDLGTTHQLGITFHFASLPSKKRHLSQQADFAASPVQRLTPPDNIKVTVSDGSLKISWNAHPGFRYLVYARFQGQTQRTRIISHPVEKSIILLKKPYRHGKFFFSVTKIDGEAESAYSPEVVFEIQ